MLNKVFPFLLWFKDYSFAKLRVDFVAGLTVALVLIPQSMAYAQLAGLPAYYGLYAAFLPPMVASLFGSSRQLATGPVAVVSLMTAAALEPLASAGSETFIAYAVLLALIVGLFQLSLGVFKLGMIVNFLSHPVVNGFTNAAAIIIASSQLSKLFGVYVDKAEHHYETIYRVIVAAFHYTHWPSLALAILAFGIMYGMKKVNPRIPFVLVAVVITSVISWATGFQHDAKVSLSGIESQVVRNLVGDYNKTIDEIETTVEKRAQLGNRVADAKTQFGTHSEEYLDLSHELDLDNFHLDQMKEKAHHERHRLRNFSFKKVQGDLEQPVYYPFGKEPKGAGKAGGHWRIKIGNTKLNTQSLTLIGGGAVVGEIPKGLPAVGIPKLDIKKMIHFLPIAIIISLLGFMEAISIAKAMAVKTGQRLDPNQELIGQGLANIVGSFGQSYPVSGSFSRSAVNIGAGAISGLSSVFTSLIVIVTLLFFTPLLYYIPQSVLAAVIMMAVIGLINIKGFLHAYRAQKYDGIIAMISFVATLAFAPHLDKGIMIGVVLSLAHYLYRNTKPVVSILAKHPDGSLRDARRHNLKECTHIAVLRFEGALFFANVSYLDDQITERIQKMPELRHILLACHGFNEVDASGEEMLSMQIDKIRETGKDISFTNLNESVLDLFRRTHLYEKIGADHIFASPQAALRAIYNNAHHGSSEVECPLTSVCYVDLEHVKPGEPIVTDFRILIVDDEEELTLSLAKKLKKKGLRADVSTDPIKALEMMENTFYEIVVMDVRMPKLSGKDLLVEVHQRWPRSSIIMLTGHSSSHDAFEMAKIGAYEYLTKPCTADSLLQIINKALIEKRTAFSDINRKQ